MAKGDAAIHAAGALLLEFFNLHVIVKLAPIADTFQRGTISRQLAEIFDETSGFAHSM
jgi:hypothetical protein